MANTDNPRGLLAKRHRNGAPYNGSVSLYHVPSSNSTPLAPGDPVTVTGTADSNGIPDVARTTPGTGNAITGVVRGRASGVPRNSNGEFTVTFDDTVTLPTSTEGYLVVEDNPDVVFEIQCDGTPAATDISSNANLAAAVDPNALGYSQFELDATTFAVTQTHQLKVLRLVQRSDNELGQFAKLEVMINQHTQAPNTAGV